MRRNILSAILDRAAWKQVSKGQAVSRWNSVVDKIWKNMGELQHETGDCGWYTDGSKRKGRNIWGKPALRRSVDVVHTGVQRNPIRPTTVPSTEHRCEIRCSTRHRSKTFGKGSGLGSSKGSTTPTLRLTLLSRASWPAGSAAAAISS